MGGSVSFDRAADYYDATRRIDERALAETIEILTRELGGRGPILEIGVGTGQLALPLAGRGLPVVGLDLSAAMLAKIVEKAAGRAIPLVRGDATRLPLADGSFGGGYARWVLHLIPNWREAVAELCRVVRPGGVVVIWPGGYSGLWQEVWLRYVEEVGEAVAPPGLDARRRPEELDEAFASLGAERRDLPEVTYVSGKSLSRFFDEVAAKMFSWTWGIPDDDLERATRNVRAWALERYGDLEHQEPRVPVSWRAYDLPAP
jgi:SAM-dependent methyltransferase